MLYSNSWQPSWVNKNNTLIQIYHIFSYFIIYSMFPLLTFFHSSLQVLLADEDINFGEVYWGKIGTRSVTHQLYWHAMLYECQQQLYEFKKLIAVSVIHFYTFDFTCAYCQFWHIQTTWHWNRHKHAWAKPTSTTLQNKNLEKNYSKISFAVTAIYYPDCIRTRPAAIHAGRNSDTKIATHPPSCNPNSRSRF